VEKITESLCTFSRRPFWKRWQTKLSKLSQHLFFILVRELAQGNPYTKLCVKHCTASCQYRPRHWPHHQHSTQHMLSSGGQVWKIYSKFGDTAPSPNTSWREIANYTMLCLQTVRQYDISHVLHKAA
jgi:hypothetical protein